MIDKKLKEIFFDIFDISKKEINEQNSIDNIENWDSLSHIRLIVAIEKVFNIKINDEEIIQMNSYTKIIKILKNKGIKE